jgi:hypothetical protein
MFKKNSAATHSALRIPAVAVSGPNQRYVVNLHPNPQVHEYRVTDGTEDH